jgi:anti-anti-sigma factor
VGGVMMGLTVHKKQDGSSLTLTLNGILDISTSSVIDPFLEEMEGIQLLVFDFSGLEFIDSTGIGSIMNAIYLSKEKNFQIKFQNIDEMTDEVFQMVGLYEILEAFQKEEI